MVELAADGLANKEIARSPLRHRAHGRGAPQARLREARHPLAHAARAPPFRARVGPKRLWVFGISPRRARPYGRRQTQHPNGGRKKWQRPRRSSATASTPSSCSGRSTRSRRDPSIAKFQFRARNRWIDGAHNRTTIRDFYAANQEDTSRADEFVIDAGEPAILLGSDTGAEPGRVPAARARRVPDDVARLRRRRPRRAPDGGRVDARGRHGRAGRARPVGRLPQRLRADPRQLPRRAATRPRRSCARSSNGLSSARPCSTWSRTASPSPSTWRPRSDRAAAPRATPPTMPTRTDRNGGADRGAARRRTTPRR